MAFQAEKLCLQRVQSVPNALQALLSPGGHGRRGSSVSVKTCRPGHPKRQAPGVLAPRLQLPEQHYKVKGVRDLARLAERWARPFIPLPF